MTENTYRPRLNIELTQKQYDDLQRLVPWGLKNELFLAVIDDLIELLEKGGEAAIAFLITRKIRARDCLTSLKDINAKLGG